VVRVMQGEFAELQVMILPAANDFPIKSAFFLEEMQ